MSVEAVIYETRLTEIATDSVNHHKHQQQGQVGFDSGFGQVHARR
jgi:hypothetical protein